jgi:hypothetical protein
MLLRQGAPPRKVHFPHFFPAASGVAPPVSFRKKLFIANQARKDYDQTQDYLWIRQTEQNNRDYSVLSGLAECHT